MKTLLLLPLLAASLTAALAKPAQRLRCCDIGVFLLIPAQIQAVTRTSAELDAALRSAKPGGVIVLAPGAYTLKQHVGSLRFEGAPLTIRSLELADPALIDCSGNCYISGALGVTFEGVRIRGRMNFDAVAGQSGNLTFRDVTFEDASWPEVLKLTHLDGVLIERSRAIRSGAAAHDRIVNAVGVDDLVVQDSYFERCHTGCIQAKGGSKRTIVRRNLINGGGERPIQLGGSTCPTCWRDRDKPAPEGYESLDGEIVDNVIVGGSSCWSLSTQRGARVHHNTCWIPAAAVVPNANGSFGGGQWLFRLLQEADPGIPAGVVKPSADALIEANLWLYPVRTVDGRAGINSSVVNWSAAQPIDAASFRFERNAIVAVSPIVNAGFGATGIYPHRHPAANPPLVPFDWRAGSLDQVNPRIVDWGLGSMRSVAGEYAGIGARVSRSAPAGGGYEPGPRIAPTPLRDYPEDQPLYGWEWPGWAGPIPDEQQVSRALYILRLRNGTVLLFDSELEALEWLAASTIERVERVP